MHMENRIKLAKYHNARGIRMLKCARSVETCGHKRAFNTLAAEAFEARDYQMQMVRVESGRRKTFLYQIELLGFVERGYIEVAGRDELEAGAKFEAECEVAGVDPGIYRVAVIRRVLL